jgi:hypothetical protein
MCRRLVPCVALVAAGAWSNTSFGAPDDDAVAVSISGAYGMRKSGLVESNDSTLSYGYGARFLAGDNKNILVEVRGDTEKATFALNKTSYEEKNLSFVFGWQGDWMRLGAGIGYSQIAAKLLADSVFDTNSRNVSGLLGFHFGVLRGARVFVNTFGDYPFETKEATKQKVKIGTKLSLELGTSFDATRRAFDVQTGVRYLKQTLSLDGKGSGDTVVAPFLGVTWNLGM